MLKLSILLFLSLLFATVTVQASSHGNQMQASKGQLGKGKAMRHANPLPNLMKVVKKYSSELNLTAEQKANLTQWSKNNGPIVKGLVKEVINAEMRLNEAALSNASQPDLQDLMDKVLGLRLQLAQRKIACRENMRQVLNNRQWNSVVTLYKQRIM